jgi:hypothetical protein
MASAALATIAMRAPWGLGPKSAATASHASVESLCSTSQRRALREGLCAADEDGAAQGGVVGAERRWQHGGEVRESKERDREEPRGERDHPEHVLAARDAWARGFAGVLQRRSRARRALRRAWRRRRARATAPTRGTLLRRALRARGRAARRRLSAASRPCSGAGGGGDRVVGHRRAHERREQSSHRGARARICDGTNATSTDRHRRERRTERAREGPRGQTQRGRGRDRDSPQEAGRALDALGRPALSHPAHGRQRGLSARTRW